MRVHFRFRNLHLTTILDVVIVEHPAASNLVVSTSLMSVTTTLHKITETSIVLSPSKRSVEADRPSPSRSKNAQEKPSTHHTCAELYSWTFTQDAIAPCFVKDVYAMKENEELGEHAAFSAPPLRGLGMNACVSHRPRLLLAGPCSLPECAHRGSRRGCPAVGVCDAIHGYVVKLLY